MSKDSKIASKTGLLSKGMLSGGALMLGLLLSPVSQADAASFSWWAHVGGAGADDGGSVSGMTAVRASYSSAGETAWISADPSTGIIRAYTSSVPGGSDGVDAGAEIWGNYTLNGSNPGDVINLAINYSVDGVLTGPANPPTGGSPMAPNSLGTGGFGAYSGLPPNPVAQGFRTRARTTVESLYCESAGCPGYSIPINWPGTINLNVIEGTPFMVRYSLDAWSANGGVTDLGSTARLSFTLPDGTWITSDTGYTQQSAPPVTSGVPEPSTLLLLGSALTGLAAAGRLRKR